ncbi:hypothetical protein BG58_04895, partial [Caballeronia jiangsuensis]
MKPIIRPFFDSATWTVVYAVYKEGLPQCAIIDSVLAYDPKAGRVSTASANKVITFVRELGLHVEWIFETHAYADHLSAAMHLYREGGGRIAIGEKICRAQGCSRSSS